MTGKTYMLRTCAADMTARGGFIWPTEGPVSCPDWDPRPVCGNGLHGLLMGAGQGTHLAFESDAKWLVVEVDLDTVVDLGGKVKVPRGVVIHCGDRRSATDLIISLGADPAACVGAFVIAGDNGTATAGECGTATAGNYGTATAGECGTATAGECGTATAGYRGTATAGECGTATAGNYGTATAGECGTATAGNYGTATAGNYGTATAGECGELRIRWWDGGADRYRVCVGYVGEEGIEAGVAYRVVGGKLVEACDDGAR